MASKHAQDLRRRIGAASENLSRLCLPLIRSIGSRRPADVFVMEPAEASHLHDPALARRLHTPRLGCVLGQR
jgi:hypothetical protein